MKDPTIVHHTFVIERHYPVPPERVFTAFSDPAQKRRWHAEGASHELDHFETDFRVGGIERAEVRLGPNTPLPGMRLSRESRYEDIVPKKRIVVASSMALEDKRFSVSLETFELLPSDEGTDLIFTHQAAFFEGADGPQMRQDGWKKLLEKLAEVVSQSPNA